MPIQRMRCGVVGALALCAVSASVLRAQDEVTEPPLTAATIDSLVLRSTFDNGFRVALLQRRQFPDEAEARLILRMGSPDATAGRVMDAKLAGRLIEAGSRTRSGAAMRAEFQRLGVQVQFRGHVDAVVVVFSGKGSGLLPALELVYDALRNPAYPDSAVNAARAAELQRLAAARTDPMRMGRVAFDRRLLPWPANHPNGVELNARDSSAAAAITAARLREFHAQFVGANFGTLGAVGDFDAAAVQSWARRTLGTWISPAPYVRFADRNFAVASSREDVAAPSPTNTVMLIGLQIPLRSQDRELIALEIANTVFGGDLETTRLYSRLRYPERVVVGQSTSLRHEPGDSAAIWEYAALVAHANVVRAESLFLDEVAKLTTLGLTEEEFRAGRTEWLRVQQNDLRAYNSVANILAIEGREGRTVAEWDASRRIAESLTRDEVNAAVRRYLLPSRLVTVRAGVPPNTRVPRNPAAAVSTPAPAPDSQRTAVPADAPDGPPPAAPSAKTGAGGGRAPAATPVPAPNPAPQPSAPSTKERQRRP